MSCWKTASGHNSGGKFETLVETNKAHTYVLDKYTDDMIDNVIPYDIILHYINDTIS